MDLENDVTRRAIRAARQSLGWTQAKLASKAKIDRSKLSLFEIGQAHLSPEDLKRVEDAIEGARIPRRFAHELQRKFRRQQAGMSQRELANKTQVSQSKISRWESGVLELTAKELARVEEALTSRRSENFVSLGGLLSDEGLEQSRRRDPRFQLEVAREAGKELWDKTRQLQERQATMEKLIAVEKELIDLLIPYFKEGDAKDARIAELERQLTDLRNLYEAEQASALAYDKARELRAKVEEKVER